MFFGCRRFGSKAQRNKISLVLDIEPYRYQKFISDIAGHDIRSHAGDPDQGITVVRNWLATASQRANIPGGAEVVKRYKRFRDDLPRLCQEASLQPDVLTYIDLSNLIVGWLKMSR